jgi:hypothetical protein
MAVDSPERRESVKLDAPSRVCHDAPSRFIRSPPHGLLRLVAHRLCFILP